MTNDDKPPSKQASWLDRLVHVLSPTPESRDELAEVLQKSHESSIIDDDALQIMEGALRLGEQHAGDIMIPRSHLELIKLDATAEDVLAQITETGHSRFPVVNESADDVKGILLAKDLIPLISTGLDSFNLQELLRPATIIPESKRLSVLLREFREQRYHMAIVVDEYGSVSGLVTIEDILEEIVGEIEDETDEEETDSIQSVGENLYLVEAQTEIEDFNEFFHSGLSEDDYDTIGGLVTNGLGHLPEVGETLNIDDFNFEIAESDNRRILKLYVTQLKDSKE
jgi:magnesium and cobalt transporter